MNEIRAFAADQGLTFADIALLETAFTHRSYLNEHRDLKTDHNERLEFLGDAVLELVVTDFLFRKFPERDEGELTAFRAALVNTSSLSAAATKININEYLRLSRGEAKDVGRARQYILANAFEAVIGSIYMDQGYEAARVFIDRNLFYQIDEIIEKRLWQDGKSRFQEIAQDRSGITPTYRIMRESGPDHDKRFEVGVFIGEELVATGEGNSKQEAEQHAARNGLETKGW